MKFKSLNDDGYGLTLSSFNYKGVRQVGHGGRISSFASSFEMVPETGSAVIILANNSEAWGAQETAITHLILDQLLDLPAEIEPPKTIEPDRTTWDRLVGSYVGALRGGGRRPRRRRSHAGLAGAADAAAVRRAGPLRRAAARRRTYAGELRLRRRQSPAKYLHLLVQAGHALALERLDLDPDFQPDSRSFEQYAGVYATGLGSLTVRFADDALVVSSPLFGSAEFPAKPVDLHQFLLPVGLLTFEPPNGVRLGLSMHFERTPA